MPRYQKGSLSKRLINGRKVWYAQWWENGHHRSKILGDVASLSQTEAQRALELILEPLNRSKDALARKAVRLRQYVEQVYFPTMLTAWKPSSSITTLHRIRRLILAQFGDRWISSITRQELQAWIQKLALQYSAAVINHVRWDLKSIFTMAHADGFVTANPAEILVVPRFARRAVQRPALSENQVLSLLGCLPIREKLAVRLAVFEGLRPGEILALRWEDVHESYVRIERRIYHGIIDTPKNSKPRLAALSRGTLQLLQAWREETAWMSPWIFPSGRLTPLRQENYWRQYVRPHLKGTGLEWVCWQALRRTNGTLMQKYGADPKVGADQRGHGIGVSIEVYTTSDLEQKKAAVQMLDDALGGLAGDGGWSMRSTEDPA